MLTPGRAVSMFVAWGTADFATTKGHSLQSSVVGEGETRASQNARVCVFSRLSKNIFSCAVSISGFKQNAQKGLKKSSKMHNKYK